MNVPYISGTEPPPELPLGRFLPPIPGGMVTRWCHENLKNGDWVLEPFGFSPLVSIEIAQAGFPVLVAANNPIHAFLLKILTSAPQQDEMTAALQDLATASKGDERMEPYIRSLYFVICVDCRKQIEAEGFLWQKGEDHPFASLVDCPYCGAQGEQKLDEDALKSLSPLPPIQLHQARALNRIIERNDPLRTQVENALNAYPPRPIIVLQTILNKLDSLRQTPRRRDLLIAMILSAADQGNTLWAYPSPRVRPRQIVIPSVYEERNLWKAMEKSIQTWQFVNNPIPTADWEDTARDSNQDAAQDPIGIYWFHGRIRELTLPPDQSPFAAVVTTIPRPNQAFWTLSALWTGWIWGQDAVAPIRQVLSRQRYDWNWHTNALHSVFDTLLRFSKPGVRFWGIIAENEPQLLLSALLAGNIAGYQLTRFTQSLDDQLAQCEWEHDSNPSISKPKQSLKTAQNKAAEYLHKKGEPAHFQQVHAAMVAGLAKEAQLAMDIFLHNRNQATSETQKWLENIFQEHDFLTRVDDGGTSVETGLWWLVNPDETDSPLIDRIEHAIIQILVTEGSVSASALKSRLYQDFPGLFTPEDSILLNCLESYADLVDPDLHLWKLNDAEMPAARNADIRAMKTSLSHIANKLNFRVTGEDPMLWYESNASTPSYQFHIQASAIISSHFQQPNVQTSNKVLVIPGSRVNLLAFKITRDPILKQKLEREYLTIKFRLIRDLEANPLLTRELFLDQINADPPKYRSSQLALF